jgi:hypothetical protein
MSSVIKRLTGCRPLLSSVRWASGGTDGRKFEELYFACKSSFADYKRNSDRELVDYKRISNRALDNSDRALDNSNRALALSDERNAALHARVDLLHGVLAVRKFIEDIVEQEVHPHNSFLSTTKAARLAVTAPEFVAYLSVVARATNIDCEKLKKAAIATYGDLSSLIHDSIPITFPVKKIPAKCFAHRAAAIAAHGILLFYDLGADVPFIDFDGAVLSLPAPPAPLRPQGSRIKAHVVESCRLKAPVLRGPAAAAAAAGTGKGPG